MLNKYKKHANFFPFLKAFSCFLWMKRKEKKGNFIRHTFFSFLLSIPANQIRVRGKN